MSVVRARSPRVTRTRKATKFADLAMCRCSSNEWRSLTAKVTQSNMDTKSDSVDNRKSAFCAGKGYQCTLSKDIISGTIVGKLILEMRDCIQYKLIKACESWLCWGHLLLNVYNDLSCALIPGAIVSGFLFCTLPPVILRSFYVNAASASA